MAEHVDLNGVKTTKSEHQVVVLIPQPSNDPKDPLNWSPRKKYLTLFVLCWSCFSAAAGTTSFQLAFVLLAPTYHKTPSEMSYAVTAAVAGLFGGPLLFGPLAKIFGRSSVIFWCLIAVFICQIWTACMTKSTQYIPFVISRWLAGMFAALPTILTPAYIMDIFFLHQRGRAFMCLEISLLAAFTISPTIGGFIVQTRPWPVTVWWTLAPIGLAIILVVAVLEETTFPRGENSSIYPSRPTSFFKNRIVTFLPGMKVVPTPSRRSVLNAYVAPLKIGIAPISIFAGLYAFVAVGFTILVGIISPIPLQTPELYGGYGFSALQNALFSFTGWAGIIAAQLLGYLLGDRIPLWASRRGGGIWHPEYRLWNMMIPGLLCPIGLGLFGAGLQYHLHYMVLALGFFVLNCASTMAVPVCLNYLIECFIHSSNEVAIIFNCYRLAFSIGLGFFVFPWEADVGDGWTFGMAAFFNLFAGLLIVVLVWKGPFLRKYTPKSLFDSEEGKKVTVVDEDSESGAKVDKVEVEVEAKE